MNDKGRVVETVRLNNEPKDLIGSVDRLPEITVRHEKTLKISV